MQIKPHRGSVKVMVTLSLLAALGIILGKFLAFNVTEFMRFSLENLTILFAGMVFGPVLGAALGAVQDVVGCLAVGYTINPIITLGSAATGLIAGSLYRLTRRAALPVRVTCSVLVAHAIGSVLIKSAGLAVFYSLPFGVTVAWRVLNYAVVGALEAIILCYLFKSKQLLSQINKITKFEPNNQKSGEPSESEISSVFSKPGLERVKELLAAVGNPERTLKVVHVAGTNGKGSFCAFLSSVLKHSGLRVGSFNTPYLYEMRESIRIGGTPISEEELSAHFERLRAHAAKMTDKPTEFEMLTAAAYLAFYSARVDVCVVECGMGGGKDATNVIDSPLLSVITGIAIDHTAYLGTTLADIAREKAGIIKSGCPALISDIIPREAMKVIRTTADEVGAPLIADPPLGRIVREPRLDGTVLDVEGIGEVRIPLVGNFQILNASLAISAAKILEEHFPTITPLRIIDGIEATEWRGRFEVLSRDPLFIFDGAHNLDGIENALESITATFTFMDAIVITGVLRDKEYEEMARRLPRWWRIITVTPPSPRALTAVEYKEVFKNLGHLTVSAAPDVRSAVARALSSIIKPNTPILCIGSLYLYREVTEALKAELSK